MREIFGVPGIICEARDSAIKKTMPGHKPGIIWILTLMIGLLLLIIGEVAAIVPQIAVMVLKVISEGGNVDINDLTTGDFAMILALYTLGCTTIVVCLYVKLFERRKMRTLGFVKKGAVLQYFLGIVTGFAIFSAAVLFCSMTGSISITSSGNVDYLILALYLGGWLIQGMEEEVLCRGFLLTSLSRRYSVTFGVIVNSVAFASLHLLNPGIGILPFINLVLYGVFASILFIKTGNIWFCSAVHSIWNFVQGNFYGISVSGNDPMPTIFKTTFISGKELFNGGAFGLEGGLGVSAVLVLGCIILFFIPGKKEIPAVNADDAA